MVTMTRRVTFNASHFVKLDRDPVQPESCLDTPYDSEEISGHDYLLDVSVSGEVNEKTGIIVNIKEIDQIIKDHVIAALDRKLLNLQVDEFKTMPPSPENLMAFIKKRLEPELPVGIPLVGIRLEQAPLVNVEWKFEKENDLKETGMLLTRVYEFSASHRLYSVHLSEKENKDLFGKCSYPNGHGHNYILEVTITGPVNQRDGRIFDPCKLDEIVNREVVDRYDHRHFNHDIPEFKDVIPSTEALVRIIWERLCDLIPSPARLDRILVRETARNFFEYRGEKIS